MIHTRTDASGIRLFEVHYFNAIHSFLSREDAEMFLGWQQPDTGYQKLPDQKAPTRPTRWKSRGQPAR